MINYQFQPYKVLKLSLPHKIQDGDDKEKPVVSVIVTVCGGISFDTLFQTVKQVAPEGRVVVYKALPECEPFILKKFRGEEVVESCDERTNTALIELFSNIKSVDPEAVVFNWECCSDISSHGYHFTDKNVTFDLARFLVDRKSMVMFTHFSMMALVNDWCEDKMGPNPFVGLGSGGGSLNLYFKPEKLLTCYSSQLVKVGELCENGTCTISGYTCYTVDRSKSDTNDYVLDVLTYITNDNIAGINHSTMPESQKWKIDGKTTVPCHTCLTYPSGGVLLASNAHWLDISNIDVTVTNLLKVAETNYGKEKMEEMRFNIMNTSGQQQQQSMINDYAKTFVQQSTPSQYSKNYF